jgi:adenylate kinase family enzyme
MPPPRVILISGPAGAGKTSIAERIARNPGWKHVSEDDYWVTMKAGRPPGELRTPREELAVQARVLEQIRALVREEENVALEFILYNDPPEPVLNYQRALDAADIPLAIRLLRADADEVLRRMSMRGRLGDADVRARRVQIEHQLRCLESPDVDHEWVIDTSDMQLEEVYQRHFRALVEGAR